MTSTTALLHRLGVDAEPPSPGALAQLHRAFVERVPYETFWLHLGQPWGIDPHGSLHRLATSRRGGYCFHLNGALMLTLRELGYRASWHAAGVHDAAGPLATSLGNHVAVLVDSLPSETNPSGRWYLDAGLGDALHDPLPLHDGIHAQGPIRFGLAAVGPGGVGDWHLTRHGEGSFAGVSIVDRPVSLGRFTARHRHNATSAESALARTVTAQRRHADGAAVLRGCVLTRTYATGTSEHTASDRDCWLTMLADEFDLHLDVPTILVESLWRRVQEAHTARLCDRASA